MSFLDSLKKPSQQEAAPTGQVRPERRRRRRPVLITLLVLIVAVVGVLVTPAARRELRESFARLPSSYTELYFTTAPAVSHAQVVVPVSVVRHGDSKGTDRLRVWLESSTGRTTASATTTLTERPGGRMSTITRLPLRQGGQVVHVALLGHPESLHFRLGAGSSENTKGSP
ncbi:hypothetical protein [Streptomyces sp. NPDC014006]|uniref:hypothetical protein n=1 Tax=Streptomyces sp. NPDC014006 TaxID=3364870 RepID=UPI0036FA3668